MLNENSYFMSISRLFDDDYMSTNKTKRQKMMVLNRKTIYSIHLWYSKPFAEGLISRI